MDSQIVFEKAASSTENGGYHFALMQQADISEAAHVLSIAMLNNPLHRAVFLGHGEQERKEIEKMFYDLLSTAPGIVYLAKENDKIIGVMRFKSCNGKGGDEPDMLEHDKNINWRKATWLEEWAERDPVEPHWHLGPIVVLPSRRGRGVGTKLMRRFCREVDECSASAYLETDLEKNVRFYEKFGFKVIAGSTMFDVENRYMVRASKK